MTQSALIIPPEVLALCRRMKAHGHRTWVVGGCLRDMLLGRPHDDWDLATSARPDQVLTVFRRVIPTGIQHGTVTVRFRGESYELTTLRGEGAYSDGRRPDEVHFVDDIEADLARRDFTINAIAYEPFEEVLTDPFDGLRDLGARVLRAVRDPRERFSEDGLRVLRAARFVATLEVELDPATEAAIRPTLDTFRRVSPERVRDEWIKALGARYPSRAFEIMRRTGLWEATVGERAQRFDEAHWQAALRGVDEPRDAHFGRMERLAALWHGLCDDVPAVESWLREYRYSNAERAQVGRLLGALSAPLATDCSPSELRRFASQVGRVHVFACLDFRARVARFRSGADSEQARRAQELLRRARDVVVPEVALSVRELAVDGKQLIRGAGVPAGPEVGRLLQALLAEVLDEPAHNEAGWLLARAQELRDP